MEILKCGFIYKKHETLRTSLYIKLLPSFQCISHPVTFLRMGSLSNSILHTSYIFINNSSVNYLLVLISKVKRDSNPVLSSKYRKITWVRLSRQSMRIRPPFDLLHITRTEILPPYTPLHHRCHWRCLWH